MIPGRQRERSLRLKQMSLAPGVLVVTDLSFGTDKQLLIQIRDAVISRSCLPPRQQEVTTETSRTAKDE